MTFSNIKIGQKIGALLILYGLFSLTAVLFLSSQIGKVNALYSVIVDHRAPAALYVSKASRALNGAMLGNYSLAANTCPSEACDTADAMIKEGLNNFTANIADAEKRDPSRSAEMQAYRTRFNVIAEATVKATQLSRKNDSAGATAVLNGVMTDVHKLVVDIRDKNAEIIADTDALSAKTSKDVSDLQVWSMMLSVMGLTALTVGGVLLAQKTIALPIRNITRDMGKIASGDLSVSVSGAARGDEVGDMAKALAVFKDNAVAVARHTDEQAAVKARLAAERKAAMDALATEFESNVMGVVQTVASASTELSASAETLTQTAQRTTAQSRAAAKGAEVSAMSVQTVASAAEEMGASIHEIAAKAVQSATVAKTAETQAKQTGAVMQELSEAAGKIGAVVTLIQEIASQTNLLALNATIEAARAGEAGKGFAVVATEVKNLADQTAKATSDIGVQIAGVQRATQEAVGAISQITQTINEVSDIATTISAAVEEQMATVQEISRSTQQVSSATGAVASNMDEVLQGATETGSAAEQSLGAARELGSQAERLRAEVEQFISTVRAA